MRSGVESLGRLRKSAVALVNGRNSGPFPCLVLVASLRIYLVHIRSCFGSRESNEDSLRLLGRGAFPGVWPGRSEGRSDQWFVQLGASLRGAVSRREGLGSDRLK